MAKIPQFTPDPSSVTKNPPGVDVPVGSFGAVADATARIGSEVSQFGAELMRKRNEAEAKDFAYGQSMQDARDLEQFQNNLQLSMPPDYKGYSEAVQKWTDDRMTQNQQAAPSETARQLYQTHAASLFGSAVVKAQGTEFVQRAKNYVSNIHDDIDKTASMLVTTPNEDSARYFRDQTVDRIKSNVGVTIDQTTAKDLSDRAKNLIAKGLLDGLYAKGLGDTENGKTFIQKGIDILNGVDKSAPGKGIDVTVDPISGGLLPSEKSTYLDRFLRALDNTKSTNITELNKRYQDHLVSRLKGNPVDPTLFSDIHQAVLDKEITPEDEIRRIDTSNAAYTTGQILNAMATTSPDKWNDIVKSWDSRMNAAVSDAVTKNPNLKAAQQPGFNANQRDSYRSMAPVEGQKLWKARVEDPAQYVQDYFPSIKNLSAQTGMDPDLTQKYIRSSLSQQQTLGVPSSLQRITSKAEASQIATALNGASAQQVSNQFSLYEQKYGPYWSQVFNEVMGDKKLDQPGIWVAHSIPDPMEREKAIGNIINGKDIDSAFKEKFGTDPVSEKQLNIAVKQAVDGHVTAINQISGDGGSLEYANAIYSMVNREAKKIMVNSLNNVNYNDAAKQAMNVINTNYSQLDAADSHIIHPRVISGQPIDDRLVKAFMESHKSADAFDEMNIRLPDGLAFQKLSDQDKKSQWYSTIEKYGHWVTTPKMDGMRLEIQLPNGRREPVRDNNNQPLEYKFTDISQKPDKRTLQQSKPFLQRLFGGGG